MATLHIWIDKNTTESNALSQFDAKANGIRNHAELRRKVEQAVTTMLARRDELQQHGSALVAKQSIEADGTKVVINIGKPKSILDRVLGR